MQATVRRGRAEQAPSKRLMTLLPVKRLTSGLGGYVDIIIISFGMGQKHEALQI